LNKVAPSGGFAAGSGICAPATFTTGVAPQNPNPTACIARSFFSYASAMAFGSLGRGEQAVVVAGYFKSEQRTSGDFTADILISQLSCPKA
jgi:hypothetical protein